jgi:hypothetical protein
MILNKKASRKDNHKPYDWLKRPYKVRLGQRRVGFYWRKDKKMSRLQIVTN